MEQKHDSIADLELCYGFVLEHVLQLISGQRPDSVGILRTMLGDDLLVDFIELYEVWPSQREVFEKLVPFEFSPQEVALCRQFFLAIGFSRHCQSLENQWESHCSAFQAVEFILLGHGYHDDRIIDPVVEYAPYELILGLVKEYYSFAACIRRNVHNIVNLLLS